MWTSPKRYILTKDNKVVEAAPGVSGTLIVGEGCQIHEDRARQYGLIPPANEAPKYKPLVEPIIVRGPEGKVSLNPVDKTATTEVSGSKQGSKSGLEVPSEPSEKTENEKPWESAAGTSEGSLGSHAPELPAADKEQPGLPLNE